MVERRIHMKAQAQRPNPNQADETYEHLCKFLGQEEATDDPVKVTCSGCLTALANRPEKGAKE